MAIVFPGEAAATEKPDLESIESFDNSQIGGVEKFSGISSDVISITDVVAKSGDTMTGKLTLPGSSTASASLGVPVGTAPSSPAEGDVWNDSAQKSLISFIDGIKQASVGCIFSQSSDVTVASSVAETTLIGTGIGTVTLPANFLTAGKSLRITARGYISDTGTPNITIQFKLGSTSIVSTGTVALAGTISNNAWRAESIITCRTVGASGTVKGQGNFQYDESTHAGTTLGMVSTGTATVDTTGTLAVNLTVTWGTSSASNTITCSNLLVEVLY